MGDLGRGDGTGLSPSAILLGCEWRTGAVSLEMENQVHRDGGGLRRWTSQPKEREQKPVNHPPPVVFLLCFKETVSVRSSVFAVDQSPSFSGNSLTHAL